MTAQVAPVRPSRADAIRARMMPTGITRYTRFLAWASLIANIAIVGTGGLVRLTGSGLGCPTWPYCTDESLINTPEMGIHGVIEFGNRLLTFILCVIALLLFLAVLRVRPRGMRLAVPAFSIGVLIIVQAIVGGITVLTGLNPDIVGLHFLISGLIVAIAAVLLFRVGRGEPVPEVGTRLDVSRAGLVLTLAVVVNVWVWVTVFVGALTTGSGPHAGDSAASRNGLDPVVMQHVHSWPAYILLACSLAFAVLAAVRRFPATRKVSLGLLALIVAQAGVGIWQARTGLPITLVIVHMVLSVTTIAVATTAVATIRREGRPQRA
ncbi:cytochrome c oxidase assembly protein subunit 15 [Pseudoclavibacter sp. JAI123]|uniref:COX15/CtaA family protein n=1 Tax=Pseudoclavibacter sp. JAI123 TaxID=2723065 RepID=UPI0015C7BBEF|nr:COX15/CtaA family protein [Pseudoclavibacter sp. JAI123]NYF13726.1 cytochrome c oxidase assembly protein subunit 15 [Pseudoclavibacter sp. JAI123]